MVILISVLWNRFFKVEFYNWHEKFLSFFLISMALLQIYHRQTTLFHIVNFIKLIALMIATQFFKHAAL